MPDRELGFVVRPNLDSPGANAARSHFTNERSARIARPNAPLPEQVDFISVGDSQTFGQGVANDETFTGVLSAATGPSGLNWGVSGHGGVGSLVMMRCNLDLKPKFVIYGYWLDHDNRNVIPCLESGMPFCTPRPVVVFDGAGPRIRPPEDPFAWQAHARAWYGHGGPLFLKGIAASAFRNWRALAGYLASGGKNPPISASQKTEATIHVLKEMQASAVQIGAQLFVVYIPDYSAPAIKGLAPELAAPARAAGIVVLDMAARLREMRQSGVPLAIENDGHMTAAVHRAIAEEVMKHLPR